MKKAVWISLLTTLVAVVGAVIGAYIVLLRRDKEMAEYEQMVIRQDIPDAKWDAEEDAETPAEEPTDAE